MLARQLNVMFVEAFDDADNYSRRPPDRYRPIMVAMMEVKPSNTTINPPVSNTCLASASSHSGAETES